MTARAFHACYSPGMTTSRPASNGRRIKKTAIATPAELEAAWAPDAPTLGHVDATTVGHGRGACRDRAGCPADGTAQRARVRCEFAKGRDPVGIILAQEADRLTDLLPLRHGRMAASAFAFYRGAPAVMALDLSTTPRSNITVQASGDAHISNFGLFASPERTLVFDSNDFDETLPGPWEWDVKRLAASVVIAAREQRLHRGPGAHCRPRVRSWLPRADGDVFRDAPARHLVRPDDRRRHRSTPRRGGQGDPARSAQSQSPAGSAWMPSSPRPAARTG